MKTYMIYYENEQGQTNHLDIQAKSLKLANRVFRFLMGGNLYHVHYIVKWA